MKKLFYALFCSLVVLAGCSSEEETPQSEDNASAGTVEAETPSFDLANPEYYEIDGADHALTDAGQRLLRKPGLYSGDQYDETKVKEALDKLPDDLTEEQYLNELLYLLGEDYRDEMEIFLTFDSTVTVDNERPDEKVEKTKLKKAHYAILIDASGSMKAIAGGKTRMESAKEAVLDFAKQIPEDATVSMRVYGHKGSGSKADKELSCTSTENFYNGTFDEVSFKEALGKVKPAGWTPIGLVLETVKEDIPADAEEAVVYVVSDGVETCGGDPVKAAGELVSGNSQTVVNIIGYDVDNDGQMLLKKVADAGNGEFIYVDSEKAMKEYMREQYEKIQEQWWDWKTKGQDEAWDQKVVLQDLAWDTKIALQEKLDIEKTRLQAAQEYLQSKFEDNSHPSRKLYKVIVKDQNEKFKYVTQMGNTLFNESTKNGNKLFNDITTEGNQKYNETIEKKNAE